MGSAETITQGFQDAVAVGDWDGFLLTLPDVVAELCFSSERVLPLLKQVGLAQTPVLAA